MKLAASVILYNPDQTLLSNLKTYINQVDVLLVYDNSATDNSRTIFDRYPNAIYNWSGINSGIAERLNQALVFCAKNEIDFLLTMDQDSSFENDDFLAYKELLINNKGETVGMYGVLHDQSMRRKYMKSISKNALLITSGSFVEVKIATELGGFNESLFLDGVDTEYCIRLFTNGYKTMLFADIVLQHELGVGLKTRTPLLKMGYRRIHSASRIYYIVRNFLYLRKLYPDYHQYLKIMPFINEIKNGIFYGHEKFSFMKNMVKGYFDYKNKRMGKRVL